MRLQKIYMLLMGSLSILIISCEKVLNVNLDSAKSVYVIEGIIQDNKDSSRVYVTETIGFNENKLVKPAKNAKVYISEDGKPPVTLIKINEGIFEYPYKGKPGATYSLEVKIDNKSFTASSKMPKKINLDTLYVTERLFLAEQRKIATVEFTDLPEPGNAYRFIQRVDGFKENTIFVLEDKLFNGKKMVYELLIFEKMDGNEAREQQRRIDKYDNLAVFMYCIEKPIYNYWTSLSQSALGSSQTASPANPVSNIKGGALGYFSAQTVAIKEIVVD